MSGLKLSLAASIYVKPSKWVRTIPTTTRAPPSLHLTRRTIGPISPSVQFSIPLPPNKNLPPFVRFAFPKCFSSSSSANNKGAINGSGSGSGGIIADMDSDSNTSPLMQQQQEHQPKLSSSNNYSSKILTLPTVLTLGRVAAVPLLIIS